MSFDNKKQVYNKVNGAIVGALRQIVGEDDVLWGDADRVFGVERAEDLRIAIPGSVLHIFPGARHPCYLDAPAAFHRVLGDWIAALP